MARLIKVFGSLPAAVEELDREMDALSRRLGDGGKSRIDYAAFDNSEAAEDCASRLARPGEEYRVAEYVNKMWH